LNALAAARHGTAACFIDLNEQLAVGVHLSLPKEE
jgi:hypothetical protein